MRFLSLALNGLPMTNGLPHTNGLTWNGLKELNGVTLQNGILGSNGVQLNNGEVVNDGNNANVGWNTFLVPARFSQEELGSNWIDTDLLGSPGVGDLRNISGVEDGALDNRHIPQELKDMLCSDMAEDEDVLTFRAYFSALIELAWPKTAALKICCSDPAGKDATAACLDPDLTFTSTTPETKGFEPPVFAPHFLTEKFEAGQQEALTAALIPKFNTLGQHLEMDLHGILDLGLAGTKFMGGKEPGFDYYLGSSWGNAFLNCNGADADHVLCHASREDDRAIGRDSAYFGIPMFSCSGGSTYPTRESGKACFSKDMVTNEQDGCGFVASAGICDRVCVAGFCGINDPPLENRGSTNVISIYMKAYDGAYQAADEQGDSNLALKIALPLVFAALLALAAFVVLKRRKAKAAAPAEPVVPSKPSATVEDFEETDSESV